MKVISILVFMVLMAGLFCSCDEPAEASFVYGHITITPNGGEQVEFRGSLGTSGSADEYGYCEIKNGALNFTVGHSSEPNIDSLGVTSPTFISFAGIVGPNGTPTQGVYDLSVSDISDPATKTGEEYYSTFSNARIKNDVDRWLFDSSNGVCTVELFATPIQGEVIFKPTLNNKSFDYYVRIYCDGSISDIEGNNDETLGSVEAKLFFENCS